MMNYGIGSKNSRIISESLDEFVSFIDLYGTDYTSEKDLKLIVRQLKDQDNENMKHKNALRALSEVYKHFG